ncbi:MAG: hypothetical protein HY790_06945 [Deltaproteobacteria bacterium]|nr:hypothetical protein [Deltaproteobacteria bacterium]
MKIKSLVMTLAACLFLLNVCFSPPAYGGRVDVIVDHGVDKDAEAQARAAVNGIFDFFQKTYGIGLQRDIRIKLSCDKLNYKKAFMNEYGVSEARAASEAKGSLGVQRGGTLLVDLGDIRDNYYQLFVLCHEMVHFYQGQESQDKHGAIGWMLEGSAEALAAHILETVGVKGAKGYKNRSLEMLKKARSIPSLEILHTQPGLMAACGTYGGRVTYTTAAMAVLTLVEWRGYPALFTYFRALKSSRPDDAFYQAFGTKVSDFEKSFRPF